ncbi:hypothetical protein [Prosthecobacter sp.]|uniref:hypothetical protein n=1 Tax=Prosthecobacter sp. TaxID=1965333 RepID=UPI0024882A83|nr:hypothetical protein [Prosthecobacter sp.]MDI1314042.1 hypothetical protein [Prosthecobacter sp.]
MKHLLPLLFFVLGLQAQAQFATATAPAIKGKFFVSVDDEAVILLNGAQVHQANLNESESPEFELKAGDRILVKLKNTLGKGRFMLLFMSTDRAQMVSFTAGSFKLLPDSTVSDFTPADFAGFKKQAKAVQGEFAEPYMLPFKSSSKWVWGDVDVSSIGCIVTPQMFKANTRK